MLLGEPIESLSYDIYNIYNIYNIIIYIYIIFIVCNTVTIVQPTFLGDIVASNFSMCVCQTKTLEVEWELP